MLTRPKEIDPFQIVRMGPFPSNSRGTGPIRRWMRSFLPSYSENRTNYD